MPAWLHFRRLPGEEIGMLYLAPARRYLPHDEPWGCPEQDASWARLKVLEENERQEYFDALVDRSLEEWDRADELSHTINRPQSGLSQYFPHDRRP